MITWILLLHWYGAASAVVPGFANEQSCKSALRAAEVVWVDRDNHFAGVCIAQQSPTLPQPRHEYFGPHFVYPSQHRHL